MATAWPTAAITFLERAEIVRGGLAGTAILGDFEADLLAIAQAVEARPLHGRHVDENVRAAVVRSDEAITLVRVEPLYSTCSQT